VSHVVRGKRIDIGSQFYDVITSMQEGLIDYVATIRELNQEELKIINKLQKNGKSIKKCCGKVRKTKLVCNRKLIWRKP